MRLISRRIVTALSLAALVLSFVAIASERGFSQSAKQAPAPQAEPAAPEQPALKQIALTEKQVESVLAAQKDFDAITDPLPEAADAKPDPKVLAQLDEVAKKNGFANYDEYNDVVENISLVLSGFDLKSKKYVGPEAVIRQQIATVQADQKIPGKEKKELLADLNDALKSPPPAVENKGNIDLVGQYYDKLMAALVDE